MIAFRHIRCPVLRALTALSVALLLLALTACAGQRRTVKYVESGQVQPPPAVTVTPRRPSPPPPAKPPERPALREPPHYERPPIVRVWLSSLPAEPLIQVSGACRISAREGGAHKETKVGPSRIRLAPGGFKIDGDFYKSSGIDLVPESNGTLRIENAPYPGSLRILRTGESIVIINHLDIESYLRGVLGSEMPASWPREALKAQAVAARTYVLFFCLDRAASEYDVTSTVDDQMYSGGTPQPSVLEAVRQTAGQALLYNDCLFPAFYHSTCGGSTDTPSRALGRPEYDFIGGTACKWCSASKYFSWTERVSAAELAARLKKGSAKIVPPVRDIIPSVTLSDGEHAARIVHANGETTLSMADFRRIVGRGLIRSGRFECRQSGSDFIFTGHGSGHGAGLCQYGARGQAMAGKGYREILSYYYQNVRIGRLY